MFCMTCGKQIDDNTAFCQFCGAPQNTAPPVPAPVQATPAAPVQPVPYGQPAAPVPAAPPAFNQPAAPAQPAAYGQPAAPAQPAAYTQPAAYAQPAAPVPAKPAAPSPLTGFLAGSADGIPTAGISGWAIGLLGSDRAKSAKLLWRAITLLGALLLVIHTFGLWFGTIMKAEAYIISIKFSLKSAIKMGALKNDGFGVFTVVIVSICTLAVLACIALAVMQFLAKQIRGTLQFTGFAFAAVAFGKLMLAIWVLKLTSGEERGGLTFTLIWSLLVCGGLAFLFLKLSKEYAQFREGTVPVAVGQPSAYGQPAAPAQPMSYGQPAAPAQPVSYGQPAAPAQPVSYGQPAAPAQPVSYGQPAVPAQPVSYGQPAVPAQPVSYGQPAAPAQPDPQDPQFPPNP